MLDIAVHPAHHVALQRRQHSLAVALEHQRPRLVQPVNLRLSQPPAEGSAHQPLQLHTTRLADRKEVSQPRVGLIGAYPRALQIGDLQHSPITYREGAPDRIHPLARMTLGGARHVGGDIALGIAQAHKQK